METPDALSRTVETSVIIADVDSISEVTVTIPAVLVTIPVTL